jgi:hypothetical protein
MNTHEVRNEATGNKSVTTVDMRLGVVVIAVADVDRAKKSALSGQP